MLDVYNVMLLAFYLHYTLCMWSTCGSAPITCPSFCFSVSGEKIVGLHLCSPVFPVAVNIVLRVVVLGPAEGDSYADKPPSLVTTLLDLLCISEGCRPCVCWRVVARPLIKHSRVSRVSSRQVGPFPPIEGALWEVQFCSCSLLISSFTTRIITQS